EDTRADARVRTHLRRVGSHRYSRRTTRIFGGQPSRAIPLGGGENQAANHRRARRRPRRCVWRLRARLELLQRVVSMQFRDNRSTLVAGMLVAIFVGISAETLTGGETAEAANGGVNFSNSSESVLIYRSASMPNEPIGPFRERQTYPTLHHWLIAQK